MKKGKLIVIEGACDGIGKTTQYNLLKEYLKKEDQNIVSHHFPSYETYQAIPVEKYLRGEIGNPNELSPYFINSLYAIDRAITWYTKLKSLFEQGNIVLLDRYTTSSLIYQSALIEDLEEKKRFINYVLEYEFEKLELPKPDKVIFLYAPFDLVAKMRNERNQKEGVKLDIHEENEAFLRKVYDNALFVADYLKWDKVNCCTQNNLRSIDAIHKDIIKLVRKN